MPATPIVGTAAKVKLTLLPSGTEKTLKNQKWTINPKNRVKETINTTDGIVRVAGLDDFDGTIEGYLDTSGVIEADVSAGASYTAKFYRDGTKFWSGTIIVESIEDSADADDPEKYVIKFMKQSGTLTPPA